jgi:acetyl esterase
VLSVHYRTVADGARWPTGQHDAYAALLWLAEGNHATHLRYDPTCIVTMGDSAGGHLAAVLPMMAAAHGGPAVAAQVRSPLSARLRDHEVGVSVSTCR